ncbi:MAG: hypothetical protein AAFN70_09270, partial [Planctomycetota bacterium]
MSESMEPKNESSMADAGTNGPVSRSQRIVSLDVIRGFAVLGILVLNIISFSMPTAAYSNPLVWGGTDSLSMVLWAIANIFFESKMMAIFS